MIFSLPPGQGLKNEKSVTFSVLFLTNLPVYTATGDVGTSWLAHRDNRVSSNNTVSQLKLELRRPVYSTATQPAFVSSQFKVDLKERATTNEADLRPNKSHATANVSLLARLQKLSTATSKKMNRTKDFLKSCFYPFFVAWFLTFCT